MNGELVYDIGVAANTATAVITNEKWAGKLRVYPGSETQLVDPAIEAYEGVGESSAYRGTAYILFESLDVTRIQTLPMIEAEVVYTGSQGPLIRSFIQPTVFSVQLAETSCINVYNPITNEVWTVDRNYNYTGSYSYYSGPARLTVFDTATNTFPTTVSYPDLPTSGNYWLPFSNQAELNLMFVLEWGMMLAVCRAYPGLEHNHALYDAATRVYVGNFYDGATDVFRDMHPYGGTLVALDAARNIAVFNYNIYTLTVWQLGENHCPALLINTHVTASLQFSYAGNLVTSDGTIWCARVNTPAWAILSPDTNYSIEYVLADSDEIYFGSQQHQQFAYDASRDAIYYWGATFLDGGNYKNYLKKIDCQTRVMTRLNATAFNTNQGYGAKPMVYDATTDKLQVLLGCSGNGDGGVRFFDPSDGSYTTITIPDTSGSRFRSDIFAYAPGVIWATGALWSGDPTDRCSLNEIRFNALTSIDPTLQSVHEDICAKVGLTAGQQNNTAIASPTVRGYVVTRTGEARTALEPLLQRYSYDCVESDLKIKAVLRGGASAITLTEDDLGADLGEKAGVNKLTVVRQQEAELPREVRVAYPDKDAAYTVGMQYDRRIAGLSKTVEELATTLVLTANEARQFASRYLFGKHSNRLQLTFMTTNRYAWLEPTDVFTVTRGGIQYNVRSVDKTEGSGTITWAGPAEDANVYSQAGAGGTLPTATTGVVGIGFTNLQFLDVPALREQDISFVGPYASAVGYAAGWRGAVLSKSTDFVNYSETGITFGQGSSIGVCGDPIANFYGGNVFDELNTLVVTLYSSSVALSNATSRDAVLAGENHAAYGDEIVGYRLATLIGTNQYRLYGLLRGRAGTEQHMGTHVSGERFVALKPSVLQQLAMTSSEINNVRYFKATTVGHTITQTSAQPFTFTNVGQKCLSPVDLRGSRDASGNITGTFRRRARGAPQWSDSIEIPLNEATERYEVDVWNSTYTTLKRAITGLTSASFPYSSADQTTDFGSNQNPIYVDVYQLNDWGRGFKLRGTL
jgi:hypothetical protein